jgi:CSLREA domain-containing protein
MPRPGRILFLALFTLSLGLYALPNGLLDSLQPASAAAGTFTVNSSGDTPDSNTGDGVCNDGSNRCTLRAAIQQANATAGGSTINVLAVVEINLTSALPDIAADMTISGPGARRVTVSGGGANRVFNVNSGVTVTISGLTISGGRASNGAGINNAGTLNVNNCAVTSNASTGNGAGIFNSGILNVNDSTISGNTSAAGAAAVSSCSTASQTF